MLPVIYLKRINHHLHSWQCGAGGKHGVRERLQSLSDTSYFRIASHNRVIISSLSLSTALPLSLAGIMGNGEGRGVQAGPIRSRPNTQTHTHAHTPSMYLQSGQRKKKRSGTEGRSENRFSVLKAILGRLALYNLCVFGMYYLKSGDIRRSIKYPSK